MGKKRGSASGAAKKPQQQRQAQRQPQKKGFFAGIKDFFRGVRSELKKVSWPNREQLRQSTTVVVIIVLVLGVYVFVWDRVFEAVVKFVFL